MKIQPRISNGIKKISDFFSFDGIISKDTDRAVNLEDYNYPSLSNRVLPYEYYDEKESLFLNQHNTGVIYRITPLTGANEQIAEQLDNLLRSKVSDEFTMQLIMINNNQVGPQIDAYSEQFESSGLEGLEILGKKLNSFYKKAATSGFKTRTFNSRLSNTDCFIVIDKEIGDTAEIKSSLKRFRISFEAALTAAHIGYSRGNAEDLLHIAGCFLAQDTKNIYPKPVSYDPNKLLKHQISSHAFAFNIDDKDSGMNISEVNHDGREFDTNITTLTVEQLPDEFCLWSNIDNSSNILEKEAEIPCNHIISVIYKVAPVDSAQRKANRKVSDLKKKSNSDYADRVSNVGEQLNHWKQFKKEHESYKTRSVRMLYNVVLFSSPGNKARDIEAAKHVFALNDIKINVSRMEPTYFFASMPFLFTGNLEKDFKLPTMMNEFTSWNAVQYMPILSDWKGVGNGVLLPTARGQISFLEPLSPIFGSNLNEAVTGTSGGGKSLFIQMQMLSVLAKGGDVFIIDVGGSYKKLCQALGGVYLEYKNLAMNPFTHVENIFDEMDGIISLFELLCKPRDKATDDDASTIRNAIIEAFNTKGNQTLIDDVMNALLHLYAKEKDAYPSARILAKNLERYCSNAEHGRAFNLPSKICPKARMIVVDLKEIEKKASINAPVLLAVISEYRRRMFDSDRNKQKMCAIDEAWKFVSGDKVASEFIQEGFRTGRRHNASFVTLTQGINDYFISNEAKAAWENASLKLIFLQEKDSITAHNKSHDSFTDHEMDVLQKFGSAKLSGFSEVLVKFSGGSSFHRLFIDPFTLVLLSSDGADYQAVENYVNSGIPFFEAVSRVAQEHYGA